MLSLVFLASAAPSLPLRPPLLATPSLPLRARALAAGPLPLRVPPPRMTASPLPPSDSRSSESAALYSKMERLLRAPKAKASPLVRSLTRNWLTLPPEELVENALVIGRSLFDTFDDGFELLEAAEHVAGGALSARAYGGLMRIGEAEGRHADVLALLGRMRASGAPPGPAVMLAAMHAAASLGDWGCVSRLFSEYAGDDGAAAPLEVLGEPAAVEELEEALRGCSPLTPGAALTRYDTEAIRLAVRAHCARGDGALAEARSIRDEEKTIALPLCSPRHTRAALDRPRWLAHASSPCRSTCPPTRRSRGSRERAAPSPPSATCGLRTSSSPREGQLSRPSSRRAPHCRASRAPTETSSPRACAPPPSPPPPSLLREAARPSWMASPTL